MNTIAYQQQASASASCKCTKQLLLWHLINSLGDNEISVDIADDEIRFEFTETQSFAAPAHAQALLEFAATGCR